MHVCLYEVEVRISLSLGGQCKGLYAHSLCTTYRRFCSILICAHTYLTSQLCLPTYCLLQYNEKRERKLVIGSNF